MFFFSFLPAISQDTARSEAADRSVLNYGGRRISTEAKARFSLIGVKVQPAEKEGYLTVSLYFNDIIDVKTAVHGNIFLNERPLLPETRFYFLKNGHGFSFIIKKQEKNFALRFAGIKNLDGTPLNPVRLEGFDEHTFWQYSREEGKWQKF
jgi:hypothetical protein